MGNKNTTINKSNINKKANFIYNNLKISSFKINYDLNDYHKFYKKNKNIFDWNFIDLFNKYTIIKTKSIFDDKNNSLDFFLEKKYIWIDYNKNRNEKELIKEVEYNNILNEVFYKDIEVVFASFKGNNYKELKNKSDLIIFNSFNIKIFIWGEGHGPFGHFISNLITNLLFKKFIENYNLNDSIKTSLKHTFKCTQKTLIDIFKNKNLGFDIILSGFSGQVAIILNNILYLANIGDNFSNLYLNNNINITSFKFNFNHNSSNTSELERIYKNGGEIKSNKIFVKGKQFPGIIHTRCLGNVIAQIIGAHYIPEIKIKSLDSFLYNDNLLILGNSELSYLITDDLINDIYSLSHNLNLIQIRSFIKDSIINYSKKKNIIIRDICFIIIIINNKEIN